MDGRLDLLTFKPVTNETWNDFEALFESRGGPKSCWFMVWRATGEESKHGEGKSRKTFIRHRIFQNTPVGILGYLNGKAVSWCSIAPKETYRNLTGKQETGMQSVWSLACYFIKREHRSKGFIKQMTKAGISYAKDNGATTIEAYPVEQDSPSYRFMGFVPMFREMGFKEIGMAGSRRHIMVLKA
jgi:predicted GNAT family acetyltransferase